MKRQDGSFEEESIFVKKMRNNKEQNKGIIIWIMPISSSWERWHIGDYMAYDLLKLWGYGCVGLVGEMLPPNDVEWVAWKIQRRKWETLPPRTMKNPMMNCIFKKEKNQLNLVQYPLTSSRPPPHPSVLLLEFEDTQWHHIYLTVDNKASVSVSFAAPRPLQKNPPFTLPLIRVLPNPHPLHL